MTKFPLDCPCDCPHLSEWDMSVDDYTYYCDLLQVQIDGCDTFISALLPFCPLTGEKNDEERHRL